MNPFKRNVANDTADRGYELSLSGLCAGCYRRTVQGIIRLAYEMIFRQNTNSQLDSNMLWSQESTKQESN